MRPVVGLLLQFTRLAVKAGREEEPAILSSQSMKR
jgi:hypothetical protein